METLASSLATRIATLERRVMRNEMKDVEATLEEIFLVRHELLTLRTMAAQSREVYVRIGMIGGSLPEGTTPYVADTADHFDRLTSLCDGEKEFLQGVLDFYQSRTVTKMNIAMERLALLTAIILPITAVSGFYGMNIIVNDRTDLPQVLIVALILTTLMVFTFRWARRQGWW
jgi:Mg2+ and Co2+ transporter CorA